MEILKEMTSELMKKIYTDETLRNAVAYAHGCFDSKMNFLHYKALYWPESYKVTELQIAEAKAEKERAKIELLKNLGNKLVFVGMGCTYEPRYGGDPCNHRIRTEIMNNKGERFFIEVGTVCKGWGMRIDFSINRTIEDECGADPNMQGKYYNYKNLEHRVDLPDYTEDNIIKLINKAYNCNFTEMVADDYNLTTDDYISTSK